MLALLFIAYECVASALTIYYSLVKHCLNYHESRMPPPLPLNLNVLSSEERA